MSNVSTLPDHLTPFQNPDESRFGSAVATNNASYIIFSLHDSKVLRFDFKRNEYIIENVAGNIPDVWYDPIVSSIFEDDNTIIVFTINQRTVEQEFGNLSTKTKFGFGKYCQVLTWYLPFTLKRLTV